MAKRKRKPRQYGFKPGDYCQSCNFKIRDVIIGLDDKTGHPAAAVIKHWFTKRLCYIELEVADELAEVAD